MSINFIKLNKKIIIFLVIILFICSIPNITLGAGSFSISASSKSITVGGTTTITITAKNCAGQFSISSSNSSVVSVSSSSVWLDSSSTSITLTAKSKGTATITIKAVDVTDTNLNDITGSKTCKVTVSSKSSSSSSSSSSKSISSSNSSGSSSSTTTTTVTKSTDSSLKLLEIKEGTITPEFSKDVKEYSISVPYETEKINVTATPTDSKATTEIKGNKDLKEGENTVTITVTAEDGSTSSYVIKVTKARVPLALQSLIIKYKNQEGELIEIPLDPTFDFSILEYSLEDLEYWVEKLTVEAVANIEGTTIDIQGAEDLQVGENTITITLSIPSEETQDSEDVEEPEEETITYTIKVNKNEEPTLIAKISNWFKGIMGTISSWYNDNTEKVILGALGVCIVALIGLSVYIVVDYNKYKDVIAKAKKLKDINNTNVANASNNVIEEIHQKSSDTKAEVVDDNYKVDKPKGGKHF